MNSSVTGESSSTQLRISKPSTALTSIVPPCDQTRSRVRFLCAPIARFTLLPPSSQFFIDTSVSVAPSPFTATHSWWQPSIDRPTIDTLLAEMKMPAEPEQSERVGLASLGSARKVSPSVPMMNAE